MTTVTQSPTPARVTAIWSTKFGDEAYGTEHDRYYATVIGNGGREVTLWIDPAVYSSLSRCATPDDYRDGDYISFAQPLIF